MELEDLLQRVGDHVTVGRAFGPAYEKDETLIIPVAFVAGGGGGGSDDREPGAHGAGLGGVVHPLGAYVVRSGQVRFVPSFDATLLVGCLTLVLCGVLSLIRRVVTTS